MQMRRMKRVVRKIFIAAVVCGLCCGSLVGYTIENYFDLKKDDVAEETETKDKKSVKLPEGIEDGKFTARRALEGKEDEVYQDFEYDENGNILKVKIVEVDDNGESVTEYKNIYEYEYDENGKIKHLQGKNKNEITRSVDFYDDKVIEKRYDQNNKETQTDYYLNENRIVKKMKQIKNGEENEYEFPMLYEYYDNGEIKSITNESDIKVTVKPFVLLLENMYFVRGTLEYDEDGKKVKDTFTEKIDDKDYTFTYEWEYDKNGWCTREVTRGTGSNTYEEVYNWEYSN